MLKKEKGVTLIQVIVTMIIAILIASFAVWYAKNVSTEAKLTRIYNEMSTVKDACKDALVINELNPDEYPLSKLFTKKITSENIADFGIDTSIDTENLYVITPENAGSLELEKVKNTYIYDAQNNKLYIQGGFSRIGQDEVGYEFNDVMRLYKNTLE